MKKFILENKKNILVSVLIICVTFLSEKVYASDVNPGVEVGKWLQTNAQGFFTGLVAVVGLFLAVTRQIIKLVLAIIVAAIASILVYGNESFLMRIGNLVSSWF